jgi:hypothetical protein
MKAPIITISFVNAVLFSVNGISTKIVRNYFGIDEKKERLKHVVLTSQLTASVYCLVFTPIEEIKIRLQLQTSNEVKYYKGPLDTFTKIIKSEGFKHFLKLK